MFTLWLCWHKNYMWGVSGSIYQAALLSGKHPSSACSTRTVDLPRLQGQEKYSFFLLSFPFFLYPLRLEAGFQTEQFWAISLISLRFALYLHFSIWLMLSLDWLLLGREHLLTFKHYQTCFRRDHVSTQMNRGVLFPSQNGSGCCPGTTVPTVQCSIVAFVPLEELYYRPSVAPLGLKLVRWRMGIQGSMWQGCWIIHVALPCLPRLLSAVRPP